MLHLEHPDYREDLPHFIQLDALADEGPEDGGRREVQEGDAGAEVELKVHFHWPEAGALVHGPKDHDIKVQREDVGSNPARLIFFYFRSNFPTQSALNLVPQGGASIIIMSKH